MNVLIVLKNRKKLPLYRIIKECLLNKKHHVFPFSYCDQALDFLNKHQETRHIGLILLFEENFEFVQKIMGTGEKPKDFWETLQIFIRLKSKPDIPKIWMITGSSSKENAKRAQKIKIKYCLNSDLIKILEKEGII